MARLSGGSGIPAGTIADFAADTLPAGWLACDGANVSRTTYARLFTAIGTTYGAGDGSTTFAVPDCSRRATIGKGGTATSGPANTVGSTGGAETHALASGELASHSHGAGTLAADSGGAHAHNVFYGNAGSGGYYTPNVDPSASSVPTSSAGAHTHTLSGSSASAGSGTAHNNMPPSLVVSKMIKV